MGEPIDADPNTGVDQPPVYTTSAMRSMPSPLRVVVAGVLLAGAACSSESGPPVPAPSGVPAILEVDCLDLEHGGQHLALDVVGGLHALNLDRAALNADFSAGRRPSPSSSWRGVLLGASNEKDADGIIYVWATDRTSQFPAIKAMRPTVFESSSTDTKLEGPRPGEDHGGRQAGRDRRRAR